MFNNQRDRRYSIIVTAVAALACAGVFWIRSAPPKGAPAGTTPATFNLTDPLPQAHDGAREVIGQVYECVIDGKRTFSNRSCTATK